MLETEWSEPSKALPTSSILLQMQDGWTPPAAVYTVLPDTAKGSKPSTSLLRWTSTGRCALIFVSSSYFVLNVPSSIPEEEEMSRSCSSGSAVAYGRGGDRRPRRWRGRRVPPKIALLNVPVEDVPYVPCPPFLFSLTLSSPNPQRDVSHSQIQSQFS